MNLVLEMEVYWNIDTLMLVILYFQFLEPTVYNSSRFGDGDGAIIYSNFDCRGFEGTVSDCAKQQYGSFSCSRNNVVGIKCLDSKLYLLYILTCSNKFPNKQLAWMVMFV